MTMIRSWLRVPPGAALRDSKSKVSSEYVDSNEYIDTMLTITQDDICIGESPLSINYDTNIPESMAAKLDQIKDECNTIVKWCARDLCVCGFSVYDANIDKDKNRLILLPHIDEVEFYLTKTKKIVCYSTEDNKKKNLKNVLIFINYDRSSFSKIEDDNSMPSSLAFKIDPIPMQLKNVEKTVTALQLTEQNILRYRTTLSRIARWVNVDIGTSSGDVQKTAIDSISSAINANSIDLSSADSMQFDDNIAVIPNRRGVGRPELVSDIPDYNLKDNADLTYNLGKLNLIMRFPASYMDFSKELDSNAVSLIRSDLRYAKLCASVRTKIVTALNAFVRGSVTFRKYNPEFSLAQLPTSEDADVLQSLDDTIDISAKIQEYILSDNITELQYKRLDLVMKLLAGSTNSPKIQEWYDDWKEIIEIADRAQSTGKSDNIGSDLDSELNSDLGSDIGSDLDSESNDDEFQEPTESEQGAEEQPEKPDDVEFIKSQS